MIQDHNPLEGLKRLAFGPINDAVRLLVQIGEFDASEIDKLDLFSVSEIKQNKEGCLEIKFYDRLKAFELLSNYTKPDGNTQQSSFYEALESAAKLVSGKDEI